MEQKKYLGFIVDPQLTFSLHVDYAVCKTKKALAKASLLKGRFGLPVHIQRPSQEEISNSAISHPRVKW